MKKIKLIGGLHLTPTEKRHIALLIENGNFEAKVNRFTYNIKKLPFCEMYNIIILKNYTDMNSRKKLEERFYTIEYK